MENYIYFCSQHREVIDTSRKWKSVAIVNVIATNKTNNFKSRMPGNLGEESLWNDIHLSRGKWSFIGQDSEDGEGQGL